MRGGEESFLDLMRRLQARSQANLRRRRRRRRVGGGGHNPPDPGGPPPIPGNPAALLWPDGTPVLWGDGSPVEL